MTRDVIQSEGVLLQYASHASYQEATNNQFYEWLLDEEEGTHRHKTAFGRTSENRFQILFLELTFFYDPPPYPIHRISFFVGPFVCIGSDR